MRITRVLSLLAALLAAISRASPAQAPSPTSTRELVARGLAARITRGGIYPPPAADLRDTAVAFYPGVRFYYADVELEHGGSFRLYAAVDSTGQLYLLDSPASFRLLHHAFFRGAIDSASAITVALLAARFGGMLPAEYRLRHAAGFLRRAVGPRREIIPWAWEVTLDVDFSDRPEQLIYTIEIGDGDVRLRSRNCSQWCRTTILEP